MGKAATGHAQAMGMAVLQQLLLLLLQRHALPLVSLGMEEHSLEIVSHVILGRPTKAWVGQVDPD